MAQRLLSFRFLQDIVEGQQPWGITRTAVFDDSLRANLREYPDLKEKLLRFIELKSANPLQTRYGKHDRPFTGPLVGFAHCHLKEDAILIYTLRNRCINLILVCSHAEIEGKRMKSTRKRLAAYLDEACKVIDTNSQYERVRSLKGSRMTGARAFPKNRDVVMVVEGGDVLDRLSLRGVKTYAESLGVNFLASEDDRGIELDFIGRPEGVAKGAGSRVMAELCRYADQTDQNISLYAFGYDPRLEAYYAGFGFIPDPDGEDEAEMIRIPK